MSIPKEYLHRLIDDLPQKKTLKAKYLLETLVQEEDRETDKDLPLAERLQGVIGVVNVKGNYSENTGEKFKQIQCIRASRH